MTVVPFKMTDYPKARLVNGVGLEHRELVMGVVSTLRYMEKSGTFYTLWDGETVVLIAGWHKAWAGVCEVSFFPTEAFVKSPYTGVKELKKKLTELAKTHWRIQITCRNEMVFTNFATHLGFTREGVLRKYGHDKADYIMMSIVEGL